MTTAIQTLKRNAYAAVALMLLAGTTPPAVLAATVSAGQVTARSIEMSSSVPSATGVTYNIKFTPDEATTAEGIVVDFCSNSPLVGAACTATTAMTIGTTNPTASEGTWAASALNAGRTLLLTSSDATLSGAFNIEVEGFTNTSDLGTFYARIMVYDDDAEASAYDDETPGDFVDDGSVALSTAYDIDVTARVNESLTFCVSGTAIADGCADPTEPNLTLGDGNNGLLTDTVSAATAYFQLSTNAASGAAIKLRNSAASGGLNSGSNSIAPVDSASPANITGAGFGVRVPESSSADEGVAVLGSSAYGSDAADEYNMRHPEATNAYGDTIASAAGPTSNANVPLVFGAQASNITPAGIYTAVIVLIATSTY